MLRPVATVALLIVLALMCRADTTEPLWIDRPAAQPWLPTITAAAAESHLSPALLAELIGVESGFVATAKNPHSSALGCGQQTAGNPWLAGSARTNCATSIRAAARQLRFGMNRSGSLSGGLMAYGTTSGMTPARRRVMEARFATAAKTVAAEMVAQQIGELHIPAPHP